MANIRMLSRPGDSVSAQLLDPSHHDAFTTALFHLLSTNIARETIAQLMDGLPLYSVVRETRAAINMRGSPVSQHLELCAGSYELADDFISSLNPSSFQFPAHLLQAFQNAEPGTRPFLLRLLELLAHSVHCIAVSIELSGKQCHVGDIQEAIRYKKPRSFVQIGKKLVPMVEHEPRASLFFHPSYSSHEDYPFQAADMAGYWAEDRIFGGVVLFDRGNSGQEAKSVWLHSGRQMWTKRVWQPLEWQLQAMSIFFSTGRMAEAKAEADKRETELSPSQLRDMHTPDWKWTFPFFCDIDNFERHDEYDAMAYHQIYRDRWERRIPAVHPELTVRSTFDYPEYISLTNALCFGPFHDDPPLKEDVSRPVKGEVSENKAASSQDHSPGAGFAKREKGEPYGRWDGRNFHFADPSVDIDARIEAFYTKQKEEQQQREAAAKSS